MWAKVKNHYEAESRDYQQVVEREGERVALLPNSMKIKQLNTHILFPPTEA